MNQVKGSITLTLEGLIFQGFWAQRPYDTRLCGYFDAKGNERFFRDSIRDL